MSMQAEAKHEALPEDLERMRHSTAHLMAAAVQALWPDAKFGVGPAVKNGFYYDIDLRLRSRPPTWAKSSRKCAS